jgi:hypothetical protein
MAGGVARQGAVDEGVNRGTRRRVRSPTSLANQAVILLLIGR